MEQKNAHLVGTDPRKKIQRGACQNAPAPKFKTVSQSCKDQMPLGMWPCMVKKKFRFETLRSPGHWSFNQLWSSPNSQEEAHLEPFPFDEFGDTKLNRLICIHLPTMGENAIPNISQIFPNNIQHYMILRYVVKWHMLFFLRIYNHALIYVYIMNVKMLVPCINLTNCNVSLQYIGIEVYI